MGKVFVDVGISLDGFLSGPNPGPANPIGDEGLRIHDWIFRQKSFRENLGLGEDGETGVENDLVIESNNRAGACIMGKTMFITGEYNWPEDAPFHCPVYVLTHEKREPWVRKGGTTFYFTDQDPLKVLAKAREAAGKKDIRISGGANVISQYLNVGVVEEMVIHIAPILLGKGTRLFEDLEISKFDLKIMETISSKAVTHIKYQLK